MMAFLPSLRGPSMAELLDELRHLLVAALRLPRAPEEISTETRLFGGELGLDSVDAVEFVQAVEKRFEIAVSDRDLARYPLATLQDFATLLAAKGVTESGADLPAEQPD